MSKKNDPLFFIKYLPCLLVFDEANYILQKSVSIRKKISTETSLTAKLVGRYHCFWFLYQIYNLKNQYKNVNSLNYLIYTQNECLNILAFWNADRNDLPFIFFLLNITFRMKYLLLEKVHTKININMHRKEGIVF